MKLLLLVAVVALALAVTLHPSSEGSISALPWLANDFHDAARQAAARPPSVEPAARSDVASIRE